MNGPIDPSVDGCDFSNDKDREDFWDDYYSEGEEESDFVKESRALWGNAEWDEFGGGREIITKERWDAAQESSSSNECEHDYLDEF